MAYTIQEILNDVYDASSNGLKIAGTVSGSLTITGDLTVNGDFNFGDATTDVLTINGQLHLGDDIEQTFGNTSAAPNATLTWETADANANALLLTLPEGGATDVPVFALGDASAAGVDLGLFDGITDPTLAVISDDQTKAMQLSHDGTNGVIKTSDSGSVDVPDLTAGIIQMPDDGGLVDIVDMAVTSTPASGTEEGYIFNVDSNPILTVKTEADSSGSIQTNKVLVNARLLGQQGVDVASATNLTLLEGNVFELTGTTKVDLISNLGWNEGSEVTLVANESVVIDNGTATSGTNITIRLNGAGDYSMTADDTLTLILASTTASGQMWVEKARSVN